MSKILAVILATVAVAFVSDAAVKGLGNRIECFNAARFETRIMEGKIKDAILKMMEKLRTEGIPALNISSLDPFVLNDLHIGTNNEWAQLNWNMTNGQIVGLTHVDIPTLSFNLAGMKFSFGLNWASIHGKGSYGVDGVLGTLLPVYGHGDFDTEGVNLLIEGSGKLGTDENKFIHLKNFTIAITLEKFKAKFTGLMDDPKLSEIVSQMVTDSLAGLLTEFKEVITGLLSPKLEEIANKFLVNKTIGDIIGGLGRSTDWINCGGY